MNLSKLLMCGLGLVRRMWLHNHLVLQLEYQRVNKNVVNAKKKRREKWQLRLGGGIPVPMRRLLRLSSLISQPYFVSAHVG